MAQPEKQRITQLDQAIQTGFGYEVKTLHAVESGGEAYCVWDISLPGKQSGEKDESRVHYLFAKGKVHEVFLEIFPIAEEFSGNLELSPKSVAFFSRLDKAGTNRFLGTTNVKPLNKEVSLFDIFSDGLERKFEEGRIDTHVLSGWEDTPEIGYMLGDVEMLFGKKIIQFPRLYLCWLEEDNDIQKIYRQAITDNQWSGWLKNAAGSDTQAQWEYFRQFYITSAVQTELRMYRTTIDYYLGFMKHVGYPVVEKLLKLEPSADVKLLGEPLTATDWWWVNRQHGWPGEPELDLPPERAGWFLDWKKSLSLEQLQIHSRPIELTYNKDKEFDLNVKITEDPALCERLDKYRMLLNKAWYQYVYTNIDVNNQDRNPLIVPGYPHFGMVDFYVKFTTYQGNKSVKAEHPSVTLDIFGSPDFDEFGELLIQPYGWTREDILEASRSALSRSYDEAYRFFSNFIKNELPKLEELEKS